MKGVLLYLKDKQFYEKNATLRIVGSFSTLRSKLKGVDLLHIIDLDLARGRLSNFDVYDMLTKEKHTQVEFEGKLSDARRLQEIDVRVVLKHPFEGFDELDPKFLAARVEKEEHIYIAEHIRDIVTSSRDVADKISKNNRLFFIGEEPLPEAFCNISIKMLRN